MENFCKILIKSINAKSILEIGTLTGYSSIWMARALPEGGKLITLEISKDHYEAAKKNFQKQDLTEKIDIISGNAMESLDKL